MTEAARHPSGGPAGGPLIALGRGERRRRVALVGNPNTGKTTLFNALTGLRQRVANYPGVTVELKLGSTLLQDAWVELVDLPGMYSLAAHSPDEVLALDALLGRVPGLPAPDVIVALVDATALERNLFLVSQLLELERPLVVALTMVDAAKAQRLEIDAGELAKRLGAPVVPVVANSGRGLEDLRHELETALDADTPSVPRLLSEVRAEAEEIDRRHPRSGFSLVEIERAILDRSGVLEKRLRSSLGSEVAESLEAARARLAGDRTLAELEAEERYRWSGSILERALEASHRRHGITERVDRFLAHPVLGTLVFLALMTLAFQAVFSWATPIMDTIDNLSTAGGELVELWLPEGALASLLADGVIAGVGAVLVFLPQIIILFLFILILEDSGYMARAAFMIDRLMRLCGLSGQSFIPMLSSFACAVPGILATRVIPSRRDRLATVLAAPFMTCSARLPVYALLIAAFVPERTVAGVLNLKGLVLLLLYFVGIAGGILTALLLKRTLLRGPTPTFLMEMPPYRWPSPRSVLLRLLGRVKIFLVRAGTIIFTVAVVVWGLAYFPRSDSVGERFDRMRADARTEIEREGAQGQRLQARLQEGPQERLQERLQEIDHLEAAAYLEQSALGRIGHGIEPVFRPLGWDWRVSSAVIAAFPAREVVIAALGTIYAVGSEVDETDQGLIERFRSASWPDGRPIFTLPMVVGLMIFFALCLQCGATVAAIRRESGSWGWAAFAWTYMTVLAYVGALVTYQVGTLLSS